MASDVKNIAAGDTGSAQNGKVTIFDGKAATGQFLSPNGFSTFLIAGFDTSPPGAILNERFDDPRYYTGDAVT